ncbi:MAG: hypothetical protein DDT42_01503 [candidate division WS2 bacterium]|uniref:Uncharacterized protein n=1 Tax=Psychracetigena formicireducens TaxID=2986056 RepID=A0A9E2BMB9_PSYF1|nr:hypothetical protein [Candidatus Psychracetigena formicireducens]
MKNIINVTLHEVTFQCGESGVCYTLEPSGVVINATPIEQECAPHSCGVALVRTTFVASAAEEEKVALLERDNPGAILAGSIIAAQAFPGRVFAMVPAPGFERVPPAEKRMRDDKFTTF